MIISKSYKINKEIGSGTFGKVYLGEHIPTQSPLAIKVLDKSKIQDRSDFERVCRELKISQTILHPHLVQLYDMLETENHIFLIMEYLEGGELYDYIVSKRRLTEPEAFLYFIQVVSAIDYMHKLNIVHRDLKPENLLLDQQKRVIKLVDFGLGRFYDVHAKVETACGSPCYAPPEMLSKFKYEPIKADIWSLGIVLYAMLAGFLPFDDDNTEVLYQKIIEGNFSMPHWISAEAQDLLSKIINKEPDKRISIAQIYEHPWFKKSSEALYKQGVLTALEQYHEHFTGIDQEAVKAVMKGGYSEKEVLESINSKNFSDIYCYYNIVKNKFNYWQAKSSTETGGKPKAEPKKQRNFKAYTGPVDVELLSTKTPEEVFASLKSGIKDEGLDATADEENGSVSYVSSIFGVSFTIRVVQFVDFENGSYVVFEKIKPNKEKFDKFYLSNIHKQLLEVLQ